MRKRIKPGRVHDPVHMQHVAALPCCICGCWPVEVHHIKDAQVPGGRRAGDNETLPLCPAHHRNGPEAIHVLGSREWERRFGTQREHLRRVLELLSMKGAA